MQTALQEEPGLAPWVENYSNENDDSTYELKFTEAELETLLSALEDAISRPFPSKDSMWTRDGLKDAIKLANRLHVLVFGRTMKLEPWTKKARDQWRQAILHERRTLGLTGPLTADEEPLL